MHSEKVELSVCDQCTGVWLEDGRLGALLIQPYEIQDALIQRLSDQKSGWTGRQAPELLCPKCQLLLYEAPLGMMGQTPVGTCPTCRGNFVEFENLVDLLKGQRR